MMRWVVSVKDEALIATLRGYPQRLVDRLFLALQRVTIKLQAHVKEDKLTGQVLHVRTGTLRRSVNRRVWVGPNSINGAVGTNVEYAAAHEFGFDGVVTVKEHVRRVSKAKSASSAKAKLLGATTVKAHTRHVHLPERSFLRSALAELQEYATAEIRRAATGALKS